MTIKIPVQDIMTELALHFAVKMLEETMIYSRYFYVPMIEIWVVFMDH